MKRVMILSAMVSVLLFACGNNERPTEEATQKQDDSASQVAVSPAGNETGRTASSDTAVQSVASLEKQYAMVPSDPALAYDLAYAYAEQKNPKALKLADSLIKANPPDVEKAYYIKANYFSATGNTAEAVKNYDAAITANYRFLDAYFDKGQLLLKQKNYEQALKTFAIGQKVSPATAEFYYWVAKTQEAMGNKADAKMNYERAYALDKSLTEAKAAADRL